MRWRSVGCGERERKTAKVTKVLTWVLRTGLVPEIRNTGAGLEKEGAKMHLIFRLVEFAVFVGHPG